MTVPTPAAMPSRPAAGPVAAPGTVDPGTVDPVTVVAAAMVGLDGLADRPLAEHVDAFERVHVALGEALAAGSV